MMRSSNKKTTVEGTREARLTLLKSQQAMFSGKQSNLSSYLDVSVANKVVIIATGGTISGESSSADDAEYTAGKQSARDLVDSVPGLDKFKLEFDLVDLYKIDSKDVTHDHWLRLLSAVNKSLDDPDVKGLVITHGTDTLEETAYFLHLTVKSSKPVVIVGSMRPATSLSPDGPMNLLNAVAVVHDEGASGRGVMVVMNDSIFDARDVTKTHTTKVNTFQSPNYGPIGSVNYGLVRFDRQVSRKHTVDTSFTINQQQPLPDVAVFYQVAGASGRVLGAILETKPDGIVVAGTGNGTMSTVIEAKLKYAREQGIVVVRCSRTGSGRVTENSSDYPHNVGGTIAAGNLNPQKARILLMLALSQQKQLEAVRNCFLTY